MRREWPLTGRTDQQARAGTALLESGGVVLAGEPGVGKTRLARELFADVRRRGRAARWIGATASARTIPLGAFASLVAETDTGADPAAGTGASDGAGAGPDASVLGRLGAMLRTDVEVLGVDDAHLLDDISATLLHQLAVEQAVQLVVTVCQGVTPPDAVTALWKDGLVERMEVPALDERDTARLVEAAIGGLLEPASRRRLHSVTKGNVLLLRHLVPGEQRAGRLARADGLWRWTGGPEITPELLDLIDARIGRLSDPDRHLMELIAFGEPVDVGLLASLVDRSVVEAAADRGMIHIVAAGRRLQARLGHPLYGDAVRSRTDTLRARRRRGELARALAATGSRRSGDALRLAVLSLDGDVTPDTTLLRTAALEATALADWTLAERLLRAACATGDGFEPRLALGLTLSWEIRPDEARVELARAAELADTDEQRARAGALRAVNRFYLLARSDDTETMLGGDSAEARQYLDAVRAAFATARGRLDEARAYAARVLDAPDPTDFAVTWAGYGMIGAHAMAGRADQLDGLVERVIAAAAGAPETAALQFNIRYWQVYGLGMAGRPALARDCMTWMRDVPGRHASMAREVTGARIALDAGEVRTAGLLLGSSRTFFPGHGAGWTSLIEAGVAQARAMSGDAQGARDALARAELSRHPAMRCVEPEIALAAAWLAAVEGSLAEAAALAEEVGVTAAGCGHWAVEVVARHTAVCFGDIGQADRLAELARLVDGPRAPSAAAHAAALAAHDPDGLLAAADQLERTGLRLLAADAAAQAAELLWSRGRSEAAPLAAARAGALALELGGDTPALRAGTRPLPISAREREVATLAAAGLSNRQIAGRLHVSVPTVDRHVTRTCARLGVADRAELATLVTARA